MESTSVSQVYCCVAASYSSGVLPLAGEFALVEIFCPSHSRSSLRQENPGRGNPAVLPLGTISASRRLSEQGSMQKLLIYLVGGAGLEPATPAL